MKKAILWAMLLIFIVTGMGFTYQSKFTKETSGVRIIVDGKVKDSALEVILKDNVNYLPIKKLFSYFNIKDESITYDGTDNSYKVTYGKNIIAFKPDDNVVFVNEKEVNLISPILALDELLYVPISFINVFDSIAYEDVDANSILITSNNNYNLVKTSLEKLGKGLSAVKNYEAVITNNETCTYDGKRDVLQEKATFQQDLKTKTMSGVWKGSEGTEERYYNKGYMYFKSSWDDGKWVKAKAPQPFIGQFDKLTDLFYMKPVFYSGLKYSLDTKAKEIKLSGMGYTENIEFYLLFITSSHIKDINLIDYSYEIVMDQVTYNIKSVKFHVKGENKPDSEDTFSFEKKLEIKFNKINQIKSIPAPKGTKEAKVIQG